MSKTPKDVPALVKEVEAMAEARQTSDVPAAALLWRVGWALEMLLHRLRVTEEDRQSAEGIFGVIHDECGRLEALVERERGDNNALMSVLGTRTQQRDTARAEVAVLRRTAP